MGPILFLIFMNNLDCEVVSWLQNCQELEVVKEDKDLKVVFTEGLKSSVQCLAACKKAGMVLGMIWRTIAFKKRTILLRLYKTLVRTHLVRMVPSL